MIRFRPVRCVMEQEAGDDADRFDHWPVPVRVLQSKSSLTTMRLARFTFLLAFVLLLTSQALAQPEGYTTGDYKLLLTIDGTKYRADVGGYKMTTPVIGGDSIVMLSVWIAPEAVQQSGLPSGSTLKGKQSLTTRFYRQASPGRYQKVGIEGVSIAGLASSGGSLVLQLNLGTLSAAREAGSGIATGRILGLRFGNQTLSLGGGDWE